MLLSKYNVKMKLCFVGENMTSPVENKDKLLVSRSSINKSMELIKIGLKHTLISENYDMIELDEKLDRLLILNKHLTEIFGFMHALREKQRAKEYDSNKRNED